MAEGNAGNPNPVRDEKFLEAAKATQFGGSRANAQSHNIPGAPHCGTYRAELKWMRDQHVDPENMNEEFERLKKGVGRNKIPFARLMAIRIAEKCYKKVPGNMVDKLIDQTEGKLVQPTQELPPAPIPPSFNSEEEAAAWYAQECKSEA